MRLEPHADSCVDAGELAAYVGRLRAENPRQLLAADLFSGAGGLSLGLEHAGLQVVLGVDHDADATETHRHHFGGLTLQEDLFDPAKVEEIAKLILSLRLEVLVGGPPCQPFSRAGRSKIRHRVRLGLAEAHDRRRDLWESFLAVVRQVEPTCVLMENVPDMALDREMFIFRTVVHTFEDLGYSVEARLVDTSTYGVPQFRQRLIVAAVRGGARFVWPEGTPERVPLWNAIGDLPEVEGGWRPEGGADGWSVYEPTGPLTAFQQAMRAQVPQGQRDRVYDHITRPVREDDRAAFELMDSTTLYSDLPDEMKRYRDDIFDDKYKKLDEHSLSRTITAHIAKDGYWYIHPRQSRTLTIREAARIQTFPDWFRFAGPPSAAFRQVGNAVPPRLGEHLGGALLASLTTEPAAPRPSTTELAARLTAWFNEKKEAALPIPWLAARTRWQVIVGEILFERASTDQIRLLWPLVSAWETPAATVGAAASFLESASWLGRKPRAELLLDVARWLIDHPDTLDAPDPAGRIPHVAPSVLDLAVLTVRTTDIDGSPEPVLGGKGVLRLAARYYGSDVDHHNRMSDGRIAIARLVGGPGTAREAHLALIALTNSVCRPSDPICGECPLSASCAMATAGPGRSKSKGPPRARRPDAERIET